jgi:excisionase family DNA binding protein
MTPLGLCIVPTLVQVGQCAFCPSNPTQSKMQANVKVLSPRNKCTQRSVRGQSSDFHPPILVPIREAARLLGMGKTRTYELVDAGALEARKLGNLTMITMDSIRRFVDALPKR